MTIAVYSNATDRTPHGGEDRSDVDLFRDLLSPHMDAEFATIDAANGDFPDDPTVFDGVILGGSAAFITDKDPWIHKLFDQIRILDTAKVKTVGVCFGHQAIAAALGGVVADRPVTLGTPTVELLAPQKWMHPYMPSIKLFAGNFQQVIELPKSMRRIAMAKGNPNAMAAKDDHMISMQFHPEFPKQFMEGYADTALANHNIDMPTHQRAKQEIHSGSDAQTMAKWIAHFFTH